MEDAHIHIELFFINHRKNLERSVMMMTKRMLATTNQVKKVGIGTTLWKMMAVSNLLKKCRQW